MTLQKKTLGIVGLAFLALIVALFLVSNIIVLGGFTRQENYETREDVLRVQAVLSDNFKFLNGFTRDWSIWDDTYTYIEDHNQAYYDANLADAITDSFMTTNQLNLMMFLDSQARTVFVRVYDYDTGETLSVPADLQAHLYPGSPLLSHPDSESGITGILPLKSTSLLIASEPIVTSLGEGPVRGTLIFGRFLNDSMLQRMGNAALVNVAVQAVDDPQMPTDFRQASIELTNDPDGNFPVQVLGSNSVAAYEMLSDVYGNPALILRVETTRDVYNAGEETLKFFMLILLAVGLVFGGVISLLLRRLVLVRLARLKDEVSSISVSQDLSTRVTLTGDDELSSLASSINLMLSASERSQEEQKKVEERFTKAFNASPVACMITSRVDYRTIAVNEAFVQVLGYSPQDIVGKSALALPLWVSPGQVEAEIERLTETGHLRNVEIAVKRSSGEYATLLYSSELVEIDGEPCELFAALDITERKQTEEALRLSDEILKRVGSLVLVADKDGLISYVSPSVEAVLGYKPDEVLGAGWWELSNGQASSRSDERERIRRSAVGYDPVAEGPYERTIVAKDGVRHSILWQDAIGPGGQVIGVGQDITDRVRAEESRTAREAAEQANRAKSEFLSRMSHELRTPLNAVLGFAQVLKMDELTDEQMESVEFILKGGEHLLTLINEVLDIARIEAGRMSLSIEPVPVQDMMDECTNIMRPLAERQKITILALPLAPELHAGHILADRQRLNQVVLNLLSNAVKYNHAGGMVTLSCVAHTYADDGQGDSYPGSASKSCSSMRIKVTDTGPGIAPEKLDKLFAPFERLGAEQSEVEGTGLGLSLSKRLVEAMGGSIGLESKPGEGSTFWIELPVVDSPLAQALEANQLQQYDLWEPLLTTSEPRTVLYIEDNLSNLQLVERILKGLRIKFITTMQGRLGLELAEQHQPDMVLLDLHLPDILGDEVLFRLRENPLTKHIPVVILSADATERQIERLYVAGAHDYLTKPIDIEKFKRVLKHLLDEPAALKVDAPVA